MSALETLPPDQRAVLQLILKQGRGYADLSRLLSIDEAAVRARALAGVEQLGNGAIEALPPERRAQVADYLLGQQDEAGRDATLSYLQESPAARRWATALHEQLTPLSIGPLPEVPAADGDGAGTVEAAAALAAPPATVPRQAAVAYAASQPAAAEPVQRAAASGPSERPATQPRQRAVASAERTADGPSARPRAKSVAPFPAAPPRRSSRLGGIILIGGVAVLVAVVLVVLLNGGDSTTGGAATSGAQTQAQSGGQGQTQPQRSTGRSGGAAAPQVLAQVNLDSADGSGAVGVGWVQRLDGRPMIAVQVERIAPNGAQDVYSAWLRARDGRTQFLGFVPGQVGRGRTFTVRADLPSTIADYDEVLVTRESITTTTKPSTPGPIVLRGALRLSS
jgi:hypothetical protein